jgi:hypothetical protein
LAKEYCANPPFDLFKDLKTIMNSLGIFSVEITILGITGLLSEEVTDFLKEKNERNP